MKEQFEKLFNNEMSEEEAKNLLIELYEKGETPAEIAAAAALFVDGKVNSIKEGISLAKEAIKSGKAIKHLEKIIEVSRKLDNK